MEIINEILKIDKLIYLIVNKYIVNEILDPIFIFLSNRYWFLVVCILIALFLLISKKWLWLFSFIYLTLGIGANDIMVHRVLKPYFARLRPCRELKSELIHPAKTCAGKFGFPSNHASNVMAAGIFIYGSLGPAAGTAGLALALLVGFSRIYLGAHYPLDVLAGFIWGALWGYGLLIIYRRFFTFITPKLN